MITPDDNNDDNGYARVKRWREKNRAYVNLKQREYRRKKKNFPVSGGDTVRTERSGALAGDAPKSGVPFETKKVGEFRMIVLPEEEKPATGSPVVSTGPVGGIYRNDHGGVISKMAWEKLQKLKEEAKSGGYELDDYSQ